MAKRQTSTPAVQKAERKGGGTIDEQIAKLKSKLSKVEIARAEELVADPANHLMLTLAWKIMPKASTRALVLSKREQTEYNRIAAIDRKVADQWRDAVLSGKSEKRKAG